jgi:hypothetical protein
MTEDRGTDRFEIPPPAADSVVCSREWIALDDLRLVEVTSFYSDSHEGAGLEQCEICGAIYLRAWHEVYDDTWRYYSPVSEEEAQAVTETFSAARNEGERTVWRMVKERPALQKPPGGRGVAWIRRPTILGGPSYDV